MGASGRGAAGGAAVHVAVGVAVGGGAATSPLVFAAACGSCLGMLRTVGAGRRVGKRPRPHLAGSSVAVGAASRNCCHISKPWTTHKIFRTQNTTHQPRRAGSETYLAEIGGHCCRPCRHRPVLMTQHNMIHSPSHRRAAVHLPRPGPAEAAASAPRGAAAAGAVEHHHSSDGVRPVRGRGSEQGIGRGGERGDNARQPTRGFDFYCQNIGTMFPTWRSEVALTFISATASHQPAARHVSSN